MKTVTSIVLTAALTCGTGVLFGQQQSPPPSNPSQNSQDVPHQAPGSNNPDQQQQRKPQESPTPQQNPSQNPGDVPHQQPGTNNPDLGQQRQPDTTTQKGRKTRPKKKHKKDSQAPSKEAASTQSKPQS